MNRLKEDDRKSSVARFLGMFPGRQIIIYRLKELRLTINKIIGTRNLRHEDVVKLERYGIPEYVQGDIEKLCDVAERFDRKDWCTSGNGNISCVIDQYDFGRLTPDAYTRFDKAYGRFEALAKKLFLLTATQRKVGEDTRKDLETNLGIIRVDEEGGGYHIVFGFRGGSPTSDLYVHLALYNQREEAKSPIKAVLHPHAGNITDLASLNDVGSCEDLTRILNEINIDPIIYLRSIDPVNYLRRGIGLVRQEVNGEPLMWGSPELIRETLKETKDHDIFVCEGHGPTALGTWDEALGRIETAEEIAIRAFRRGYGSCGFRPLSETYQRRLDEVLQKKGK